MSAPGIIVNGAPLRGHDGHAGEIGHNVVDSSGPLCHCGKRGCLETYIGDAALLTLAGRRRRGRDDDATRAGVRRGPRRRCPVVPRRCARSPSSLGRAIAGLVNTLNPRAGVARRIVRRGAGHGRATTCRRSLDTYVLDAPGETVLLAQAATWREDSALLGAAEIAFAQLLADPLDRAAMLATR